MLRGKDEFIRVVKGLQYMANCMSILRTFKCIEPFKLIMFNFFTCAVSFNYINHKSNIIFYINVLNILSMHHKVAASIFSLYSVPMQFIL